jgi:hypothetical protein
MTTKELAIIERNLLPHLPGFAIKGREMFVPPVKHTLRGIHFDPSAFDKKSFSVSVFVMPLFVPSEHLTLNFADRVRHSGSADRWNIGMPDLYFELSNALKQKAVPFLSSMESLHRFIGAAQQILKEPGESRAFKNPHTLQAIAYAFACIGEFQKSRDALDQLRQHLNLKVPWQRIMNERAETLGNELRDDPGGAQRRLESWEAETIKNLGLEAFR